VETLEILEHQETTAKWDQLDPREARADRDTEVPMDDQELEESREKQEAREPLEMWERTEIEE